MQRTLLPFIRCGGWLRKDTAVCCAGSSKALRPRTTRTPARYVQCTDAGLSVGAAHRWLLRRCGVGGHMRTVHGCWAPTHTQPGRTEDVPTHGVGCQPCQSSCSARAAATHLRVTKRMAVAIAEAS